MSKKNIWIISIVIVIAALGFIAIPADSGKKSGGRNARNRNRRRPARRPVRNSGSRRQPNSAD